MAKCFSISHTGGYKEPCGFYSACIEGYFPLVDASEDLQFSVLLMTECTLYYLFLFVVTEPDF
jgi:hypothetical protein